MHRSRSVLASMSRSCDNIAILTPGTIQPHGLLLVFDAAEKTLAHWAGEFDRLLGIEPAAGKRAAELLGAPLVELIGSRVLIDGHEPVIIGAIDPVDRGRLTMAASRTGPHIGIELEPAGETTTAAVALERVRTINDAIGSQPTLAKAGSNAVEQVRAVIGYDRVMVYQFLGEAGGLVIGEARAPDVRSFMDHRFPQSDIPAPARELYRRNLVRVIPDVNYTAVALKPAPRCGSGESTIDMSQYVLRSMSPIHIQYLKNMQVGASLSISILVDGRLWGLITAHHRSARYVTAEQRLVCRHVGIALGGFIHSFELAGKAQRDVTSWAALEDALRDIRDSSDPERALRGSAGQLAKVVDCGGFALFAAGQAIASVGRLPRAAMLKQLAGLLEAELVGRESFATDRLGEEVAGAPAVASDASGVLAVAIQGSRPMMALWLRPQHAEELCWAGDPHEIDDTIEPLDMPAPRRSFATWCETVSGRSRPWTADEIYLVQQLSRRAEFTMQRHRSNQLNAELAAANATLRSLATTDPLTGLANRRLFDARLATEWQRALREDSSIAVVAIDVDHFKKYNDMFGHPAGDECLKQVAAAITVGRRGVDVAARLGGEEFGLLLTDIAAGEAAALAERVRLAVEGLGLEHPLNVAGVVSVSMGVAAGTPRDWQASARLIDAADRALYEAKTSGRNRVHSIVPSVTG